MPVRTGRLAELRRAVDRIDPGVSPSFDPREHLGSAAGVSRELAEELRKRGTDELLEILRGGPNLAGPNRDLQQYVADLVRARTGDELLDDDDERALVGAETAPAQEEQEFFVGWVENQGGEVEQVSHAYHPSNRAEIPHDKLQRYRSRSGAGGMLGRVDNRADLVAALKLQQQNSRWSGRRLSKFGDVDAKELMYALKAVISPQLKELLLKEGNDVVTLCLEGRQAVLLTRDGHYHALGRVETRHLALVGILPRHWFLPLMWWKQMMAAEEEALAARGKSKKRIYKGKYDDEESEQEEEEEKEGKE